MSSRSSLSDKNILITGASSDIGRETAIHLARKGVRAMTLFGRNEEKLDALAEEIHSMLPSTQTLVVSGDARKAVDNERAVSESVETHGGIHGAFIHAGVLANGAAIHETIDESIDSVLDNNVKGVIYALRYLIPAILKTVGEYNATDPTGSIVVTSSCMGNVVAGPSGGGSGIYSASKAFVNSLVTTAAMENAPRIRVNGIMPGVIQTSIMPSLGADESSESIEATLQSQGGSQSKATDIASLVSYLLSNEASFISGSNIKVEGLWSPSGGDF